MWLGSGCLDGSAQVLPAFGGVEAVRPAGCVRARQESEPASCRRRALPARRTAAVGSKPIVKSPASKTGPRGAAAFGGGEGGQEGGDVTSGLKQQSAGIADKATTGAQAHTRDPRQTTWAKASVWTERMLSAPRRSRLRQRVTASSCRRRALPARRRQMVQSDGHAVGDGFDLGCLRPRR